VHSGHFLLHGCQESLRVEEASQPEGVRSSAFQPFIELFIPFNEIVEPFGEGWNDPRDLGSCGVVDPLIGNSCIEDGVDRVHDLGCHDDLTVNGIAGIEQGFSDYVEDHLHSSYFLRKEDVERD